MTLDFPMLCAILRDMFYLLTGYQGSRGQPVVLCEDCARAQNDGEVMVPCASGRCHACGRNGSVFKKSSTPGKATSISSPDSGMAEAGPPLAHCFCDICLAEE